MTMVIDTSALVSMLLKEEGSDFFLDHMLDADAPILSTATGLELFRVVSRRMGAAGVAELSELMQACDVKASPFTTAQLHWAEHASLHFNKLNMGDCYSYALAKDKRLPLLFKGDDFQQTDLELICP